MTICLKYFSDIYECTDVNTCLFITVIHFMSVHPLKKCPWMCTFILRTNLYPDQIMIFKFLSSIEQGGICITVLRMYAGKYVHNAMVWTILNVHSYMYGSTQAVCYYYHCYVWYSDWSDHSRTPLLSDSIFVFIGCFLWYTTWSERCWRWWWWSHDNFLEKRLRLYIGDKNDELFWVHSIAYKHQIGMYWRYTLCTYLFICFVCL